MIADISRRVKKMERFTETAELMAKHMVEQGYSAVKIRAEVMKYLRADKNYQEAIAKNTKEYKEGIQKIIEETVEKAKEEGNKLIAEAGSMAWNNDLSMWEEHGEDLERPNSLSQLIAAFGQQTSGELSNLTRSTGFKHTVLGTTGVLQAFQREMDLATLKVATGTFSYDVAVNDCIKRLAQSGLRKIDYKSGRSYQLDTAARMCVRTGASQLAGKITEMNLDIMDHDLVITSQHMASRPEHAPIQNKVFSFSGKNKKYPSFKDSLGKGGAGYGTAEGIKGTNCTHNYYPYWEGDIIPKDIDYDPKIYENTQKQRAMERKIRATKREIEAQNAIGGDTTELKAKLKKQNKDYFAFSKKVGIRPKENRLVVISGTSKLNLSKEGERGRKEYLRNNLPKNFKDPRNIGNPISQNQFKQFSDKAKAEGIGVNGFENYCGDFEILMEILQHTKFSISNAEKIINKNIEVILNYDNVLGYEGDNSKIDIEAYAITNGKTITLNKFMFDDSVYLKQMYEREAENGFFVKGTTYLNIIDHEIGHMVRRKSPQLYNKIIAEIREKAYNDNEDVDAYIRKNISEYAKTMDDKQMYSELVPELYAMFNGIKDGIAKELF